MRLKFYHWWVRKVWQVPEATLIPWYVRWVYFVMYPAAINREYGKHFKYDITKNTFWIYGQEYSADMFYMLSPVGLKLGETVKLVTREGGTLTLERAYPELDEALREGQIFAEFTELLEDDKFVEGARRLTPEQIIHNAEIDKLINRLQKLV